MGMEITQEQLKALFDYDNSSGRLIWKARAEPSFFNKRFAGKVAGASVGYRGGTRVQVRLFDKLYFNYRLVYLYHHGELPSQVDHINGDPSDDRIENLRAASHSQNQQNRTKLNKNNTSGKKGVYRHANGKWIATIWSNGEKTHIGSFNTLEEASEAYDICSEKLHREFGVTNRSIDVCQTT